MSGIARIRPLKAKIAGTSISDLRLSDAVASYRVFAGGGLAMNDGVSRGIQLRWTGHREFEDEAEYTQIRSTNRPWDGASTCSTGPKPAGWPWLGVALSLKW